MPKPRRRLTIPVEIFTREFDAKVLLSCFAAERGFTVVIGAKRDINLNIGSLPPSIYLPINLHRRNQLLTRLLEGLGHTLAGIDEEAVVYCSPEVYVREKIGETVFTKPKVFFAWGPENARIWQTHPRYNGMPMHVTGNPRMDLVRPALRGYWSNQVERITNTFGKIILINTNFGKLNNFRSDKGDEKKALELAGRSPSSVNTFDLGMAKHRLALFQYFHDMVSELAKAFPTHTILIRPHPSESHETWKQAAKGNPNVRVHFEGPVIPWLLAADAVIHNSCTTGVEGYLLGRPVFAYQPITSDMFDKKLPNRLSYRATSMQDLIQGIRTSLASPPPCPGNGIPENKQLVEQYFSSLQGPWASENMVDVLENFDDTFPYKSPHWSQKLTAKTYAIGRKLRRDFNARFRMSSPARSQRYAYLTHIFPEKEFSKINESIACFQQQLKRFQHVQVKPLSRTVYEISSR